MDRTALDSEEALFKHLDRTEAGLTERFPLINHTTWQSMMQLTGTARECFAIDLMQRTCGLRDQLKAGVPPWRAASLAMAFQDRLMRFKQPEFTSAYSVRLSRDHSRSRGGDSSLTRNIPARARGNRS